MCYHHNGVVTLCLATITFSPYLDYTTPFSNYTLVNSHGLHYTTIGGHTYGNTELLYRRGD